MKRQEPVLAPEAAFAQTVTWRQWRPLALVLAIAVLGVLLVFVNFRLGALTLAAAVAVAAAIRATRTDEDAGLLAVRARYIDLTFLVVMALALAVLGLWVPLI